MTNKEKIFSYDVKVKQLSEEVGGGYEALFPQLAHSLTGYGLTQQEAINDLLSYIPDFLEVLKDTNQTLPEPITTPDFEEFSGKFNIRVPKSLHAKLSETAEKEGVSLNSLVQTLLSSGITLLANHFVVSNNDTVKTKKTLSP